jgi:hypothetical protein
MNTGKWIGTVDELRAAYSLNSAAEFSKILTSKLEKNAENIHHQVLGKE